MVGIILVIIVSAVPELVMGIGWAPAKLFLMGGVGSGRVCNILALGLLQFFYGWWGL